MQIKTILRILGILLTIFSFSMLPPIAVSYYFHDGSIRPYWIAFLFTMGTGLLLWSMFSRYKNELKTRDGFLIVVLFWFVLSFFSALPLMIASAPHDTLTDAMFESVSGFTTTGATLVSDVDMLPHAMRYYRQQLQFLGGMGIIVLAVAILPMLGVGGMQLYRAETPGPIKDSKLTPRITQTAKALWFLYLGLTVLCGFSFWIAGMNGFDAIGESFATVATGGFAMHDASFGYYHSKTIELLASLFMFLGGTNFALHFMAISKGNPFVYWRDEEFRTYCYMLLTAIVVVCYVLIKQSIYVHPDDAIVKSIFNIVSLATTTGFISAPFSGWPTFLPYLIMVVALVGGCGASTSGGIKVIRALLLRKQTAREINRLVHPNAVVTIKFGRQTLPDHILQAMWAFIAAYVGLFVLILLALSATGLDLPTSFGATCASLANAGAGIGNVSDNFAGLTNFAKWVMIFAMLAGRLEIFSLLVLFTPAFWRK